MTAVTHQLTYNLRRLIGLFGPVLPDSPAERAALGFALVRVLIVTNLLLGLYYLNWRYTASINWAAWPIALLLIAAETYSFIDSGLFGLTMWRRGTRPAPPPPDPQATVDVFITCYNEPVELVRTTARAAQAIRWPHQTYLLDDGQNPAMRAMADELGIGYIVRSQDWQSKARHAKAGNLNNALMQTDGAFILVLDADQIAAPTILDRTLGYFHDPAVAFVQTQQFFYNVPPSDPFGSQALLFYGPIQQGKDGWNAAFFCGSNAVLRREALFQIGVRRYVWELEQRVRRALRAADRVLRRASKQTSEATVRVALHELRAVVATGRRALRQGESIQEVTWTFQRRAEAIARGMVSADLAKIQGELSDIPGLDLDGGLEHGFATALDDEAALQALTSRDTSPLAAIATVHALLLAVDVDRSDEAQPVMPLATNSVTEDMATAMRLHAAGWRSVYHHEDLAQGLAPEDLRTALQQRLRWAQGTLQVLLRENPLMQRGMNLGQRLMYFATMWSYLSGLFSIVYLLAPILYLIGGILPVRAQPSDFFWHLLPYLITNQLLFLITGWGRSTWRGQQYSLALFPLWIKAMWSAVGNVCFGRKLGFVVTPKTRPGGVDVWAQLRLVRPQLVAMAALVVAIIWGLGRLALGLTTDGIPILVNLFWCCYDLVLLSVIIDAATYRPAATVTETSNSTAQQIGA
jgi:cellulose synthase (UDP-forming)